ncbi:MAG: hypothetical protein IPH32_16035 [Bacteroidetes bacterium]|nr:hypothetical protein [Bacteroidota bacterium]
MKKLLLLIGCLSLFTANAQNGFTTYTTNLTISGAVKFQTAFLVDNIANKWIGFKSISSGTNIANAGLVKYDNTLGHSIIKHQPCISPQIMLTALAKDNSGNIWIGQMIGL